MHCLYIGRPMAPMQLTKRTRVHQTENMKQEAQLIREQSNQVPQQTLASTLKYRILCVNDVYAFSPSSRHALSIQ